MLPILPPDAPAPPPFRARRQTTLGAPFARSGFGLHTGRPALVRLAPAPADHGIVFRRRLPDGTIADVPALWRFREPQPLCTALRRDGVLIRTVEHLMAALGAFGIDNALAEIDAEELPIFDGSAVAWCEAIRDAGRITLDAPGRTIRVMRHVAVADGRRRIAIEPGPGLHVTGHVALVHFGTLDWAGPITAETFVREIAPSRSFGRFFRAMAGRAYGFAKGEPFLQGCSPRSAALLLRGRVIGGMRVPDEPVRHRILDIVGDLALAGHPVEGRIIAEHTGHELNHALVAALMGDPAAWELA